MNGDIRSTSRRNFLGMGAGLAATELDSAVRAIGVKGQRLPDFVLAMSGVEAPPRK